jgi:hypothetical protein
LIYKAGSIPPTFGNLSSFEALFLYRNTLTGPIPSELVSLRSLKWLIVHDNLISGTIPPFQPGAALTVLSAERNNVTGTLPESLYSLASLESLFLASNALNGTISTKIGNMRKLTSLNIADNGFTGTLPAEIAASTNLMLLSVAENQFSGTLPRELGALNQLTHLEAYFNYLTGVIPTEYGNLVNVFTIMLFGNELSGVIPTELGQLENLRYGFLGLDNNSFTGSVANVFCNTTVYPDLPLPTGLSADCDEVDCPCCTDCWDDATGERIVYVNLICENKKVDFQNDFPAFGTNCTCLDDGYTLACENTQCEPCNSDGTVCLDNYDYGIDYQEYGLDNLVRCKMRYLSGPHDATEIEYYFDVQKDSCTLVMNGTDCNFCDVATCNDEFQGLRADCSNIEVGAVYDDCDPSLTGGDLLRFLRPEFMKSDCPPCLALFGLGLAIG